MVQHLLSQAPLAICACVRGGPFGILSVVSKSRQCVAFEVSVLRASQSRECIVLEPSLTGRQAEGRMRASACVHGMTKNSQGARVWRRSMKHSGIIGYYLCPYSESLHQASKSARTRPFCPHVENEAALALGLRSPCVLLAPWLCVLLAFSMASPSLLSSSPRNIGMCEGGPPVS